ncbi:DUF3011 domain-containing protein [Parvularcula marina]|uniref:DUF3011 domain-containing protein n=1 Tax=Parvularcula marina TaxID=2292771 RepID=UPI0035118A66
MLKTILTAAGAIAASFGIAAAQQAGVDLNVELAGASSQGVKGRAAGAPPVAQARPYRDNDRYGDRDRYGRERTIECRSRGGYDRCEVGGRIWSLRYVASRSSGSCQIGRDWGVERYAVWVDNGCRATFQVQLGEGGYGGGRDDDYGRGGYGELQYIKCESDNRRYRLCRINENFTELRLYDRRSDAPCRRGTDWGETREGVWVNNGCRAVFSYVVRDRYRRY